MRFEIYHQLGHNHKWNLQSIKDDATGGGVIIGPRSLERKKVEQLDPATRRRAIFDPQFFLPSTAKGKLGTYDFFPDVTADGFRTTDYADDYAGMSAGACVDFQIANEYRYIVIPTRYLSGMPSNFIESQERLFVAPFLEALRERDCRKPAILQLVLNENMLKEAEYRADLLNWLTGVDRIRGVYLITETSGTSKQIKDADFLYQLLSFIVALRKNDLAVVLGYLNTESIVLTLADPSVITMGAYENTRVFRIRTFQQDTGKQQGPNPRLYVSRCLQWIDRNYHGAIIRRLPGGADLFDRNRYQALMFKPTYRWHFTKPELYKHHFLELSKQLRRLSRVEGVGRYELVKSMIGEARRTYREMDLAGIVLDGDNDGSHLAPWLTAANDFAQEQGWI